MLSPNELRKRASYSFQIWINFWFAALVLSLTGLASFTFYVLSRISINTGKLWPPQCRFEVYATVFGPKFPSLLCSCWPNSFPKRRHGNLVLDLELGSTVVYPIHKHTHAYIIWYVLCTLNCVKANSNELAYLTNTNIHNSHVRTLIAWRPLGGLPAESENTKLKKDK